jgi:hypothetical protein
MNFSSLIFQDHRTLKGATQAVHSFENGWTISVVSGPEGSGVYGVIGEDTFEVAIARPNGNMLDDVMGWQTPVQITTIMRVICMM